MLRKKKNLIFQNLEDFFWLIVIILLIIFSKNEFTGFDEEEGRIKKKLKDKKQSRIDEFVKRSNKQNKDKEREDEFSYDEEDWDSEMQEKANDAFLSEIYQQDLKIKIEEKIDENRPFYFISGFWKS